MTIRALLLAAAVTVFSVPALAQQSAPEGQRQDETPTLTTDDVAPAPIEGQPAGAQTEVPEEGDDASLTPEERADATAAKSPGKADDGKGPAAKKGPSPQELAWRGRYAQAESQLREARRRAQEAELELTDMQNRLGSTGSTQERNSLAAAIDSQGDAVRQAQQASASAEANFEAIRAEGQSKKYKLGSGPAPTTKDGQRNDDYYRQRVSKATSDFADAERRLKIYQDRISDVRGRILNNSGSGDQFTGFRLQEELDAAIKELDKAQRDYDSAQSRRDAAVQEAAAAGVAIRPY